MANTNSQLTSAQVNDYLADHPDFLLKHPDTLALLQLDENETADNIISLAQIQRERLQERVSQLNEQLHALIDNAHSNSALQDRVHQLCLRFLDCADLKALFSVLMQDLKQEFNADAVALRLLYSGAKAPKIPDINANIQQLHVDDTALKAFDNLLNKQKPVCGRLTKTQKQVLFSEKDTVIQSVACLPLGHQPCAGILAIASEDPNRFHADMGTVYLGFLGEVLMRMLRRFDLHHHVR